MLSAYERETKGGAAMTTTQGRTGDEKPKALALSRGGSLDRAEEVLYEAGIFKGYEEFVGHYETSTVRVGRLMLPAIRSAGDDRELLGDIAKQLVIAGIAFRLVTVR
jgi:hypothetical protein